MPTQVVAPSMPSLSLVMFTATSTGSARRLCLLLPRTLMAVLPMAREAYSFTRPSTQIPSARSNRGVRVRTRLFLWRLWELTRMDLGSDRWLLYLQAFLRQARLESLLIGTVSFTTLRYTRTDRGPTTLRL